MQPFRRLAETFDNSVRHPWRERKTRRWFQSAGWTGEGLYRFKAMAEEFPAAAQWRDARQATLLHLAAKCADGGFCSALIEQGAAVNAADKFGRTPLHRAAEGWGGDSAEALGALLGAGAAIDARTKKGETPLLFAYERGNTQAIATLILLGADANLGAEGVVSPASQMAQNPNTRSASALRRALEQRAEREAGQAQADTETRVIQVVAEAETTFRDGTASEVRASRPYIVRRRLPAPE